MMARVLIFAVASAALFSTEALAQAASAPRDPPTSETVAGPCADDEACEAALERQRLAVEAEASQRRALRDVRPTATDRLPRCPNPADPRCPTGDPQSRPPTQPHPQPE